LWPWRGWGGEEVCRKTGKNKGEGGRFQKRIRPLIRESCGELSGNLCTEGGEREGSEGKRQEKMYRESNLKEIR